MVGSSSTYTPELVEGFEARRDRMPIDELVLLDTDPRRLEIVGGLVQRMLDRLDWTGRLRCTGDRDTAIDGADFVLIQLRVGRRPGRQAPGRDAAAHVRRGRPGDDWGRRLRHGMRTVPFGLDIAERVRARALADAWLIDFTNPVGIVTRALLDGGHRAIGLCNVAIGFQRRSSPACLVSSRSGSSLEHVGLNHLTWERAVLLDGTDVLPDLIDGDAEALASMVGVPADLVRAVRAIPSYYLRYYYQTRQVVDDQRAGHTRAQEVIDIESQLLDLYQDQGLAEKPALLATRGGAYYSEAAAQLIASLHDGAGDIQVVDVRNDGALPDLPDAAVVEIPARIDRDGAHPLPLGPLSSDMLGLVEAVKAYEMLTIEAAMTGGLASAADRSAALRPGSRSRPRPGRPRAPGGASSRTNVAPGATARTCRSKRGIEPRLVPCGRPRPQGRLPRPAWSSAAGGAPHSPSWRARLPAAPRCHGRPNRPLRLLRRPAARDGHRPAPPGPKRPSYQVRGSRRRAEPEERGHGSLEGGPRAAAVAGANRGTQCGEADGATTAPVPRDGADGREPDGPTFGPMPTALTPAPQMIPTPTAATFRRGSGRARR